MGLRREVQGVIIGFRNANTNVNMSAPFEIPAVGEFLIRVGDNRNCGFYVSGRRYTLENLASYWFKVLSGS